ncbi:MULTISPECIES: hypothetical protein [Streptomyces]|uniref:hypothetical protein n=1 Tax=Streptomyces TaxID=1883 RepID=UPI001CEC2CBB|nr:MULTISPECIES: hypothetical protein [Streptomyces]MDI6409620.1 hypothetical protein [Streptomyces albus]
MPDFLARRVQFLDRLFMASAGFAVLLLQSGHARLYEFFDFQAAFRDLPAQRGQTDPRVVETLQPFVRSTEFFELFSELAQFFDRIGELLFARHLTP